MRWLRLWAPAILWAVVISVFSTHWFSAEATGRYILPILKWLLPEVSRHTLELLHGLIRKAAHVVEYFIFSLLVLRGIRAERKGWQLRWGVATLAIAAGYASLDEFHQLFVPGRGASVLDVLRDTAGAALAQVWASWRSATQSGKG